MTSLGHATLVAGGHLPILLDPQLKSEKETVAETVGAVKIKRDMPKNVRGREAQVPYVPSVPCVPSLPSLPPVPRHPIPSMQDAFAESLVEATAVGAVTKSRLRSVDAKTRRNELLGQGRAEPPPGVQWRFRPGQVNHELRRLMAQISFGIYLLLNGLANSKASVVSILQGHIDEVDECLEATLEDLLLAQQDLDGRTDHLMLVLSNMPLFQHMLEDRDYRRQIVDGNEKIEHILARTEIALAQNLQDVAEGVKSTREFTAYLAEQDDGQWRQEQPDIVVIFDAMKANADGWTSTFLNLQAKGETVNKTVSRLKEMVTHIDQMAGEVSRRTRFNVRPCRSPSSGHASDPSQRSFRSTPMATPTQTSVATSSPQPSSMVSRLSRLSRVKTPGSEDSYFDIPLVHEAEVAPLAQKQPASSISAELRNQTPPARNPLRMRDTTVSGPKTPANKLEVEESTSYILQPRTYTPRPLSSQPSSSPPASEKAGLSRPTTPPRQTDSPSSSFDLPVQRSRSPVESTGPRHTLRSFQTSPSFSDGSPERISPLQPKRPALRQRVALKTAPPESIMVPPTDVALQGPASLPHSVHSSEHTRRPKHVVAAESDPLDEGLEPPTVFRPALVPSPHSDTHFDRSFFRPVQANPNSALQQRPHTAYTVGHPPSHRTTKSAMGMSTLSKVTTSTTNDSLSSRALKKKRSAFGWLKKAFSLDEEERAIFEQKRQQQAHDPYHDGPRPQFLDGRRLPSGSGMQSRADLQSRYGMQSREGLQHY